VRQHHNFSDKRSAESRITPPKPAICGAPKRLPSALRHTVPSHGRDQATRCSVAERDDANPCDSKAAEHCDNSGCILVTLSCTFIQMLLKMKSFRAPQITHIIIKLIFPWDKLTFMHRSNKLSSTKFGVYYYEDQKHSKYNDFYAIKQAMRDSFGCC
jgi:hypothetical protein